MKVWFDNELWTVQKTFKPTKYDHYLLISRKDEEHIHDDEKTVPIQMCLLDINNDTFYPDTPKIRKIMLIRQQEWKEVNPLESFLDDEWLKLIKKMKGEKS